jgi:hypothetical protein
MNPGGALRRQSEEVARQDTFFKPDLFYIMAGAHSGGMALTASKAAAVMPTRITG